MEKICDFSVKKRKNAKNSIVSALLLLSFFLLTILLKVIDVDAIGAGNSEIGFSSLNGFVRNFIDYDRFYDGLADILFYVTIAWCFLFAFLGLIQWVQRKDIRKVDGEIILLGVFYIILISSYFFFNRFPVNFRPFLVDGELKSSFPSTHLLMTSFIWPSAIHYGKKYVKTDIGVKKRKRLFRLLSFAPVFVMLVIRLLSGAHWASDLIGGILLGSALYACFKTIAEWNGN